MHSPNSNSNSNSTRPRHPNPPRPPRSFLLRVADPFDISPIHHHPRPFLPCFSFRNLALGCSILLFLGYIFAIFWTLMHPVPPSLIMASAALSDLHFVGSTQASAHCTVVLLFLNRNRQLTAMFDRVEIKLIYPPAQTVLSQYDLLPFQLTATNSTAVKADLSFAGVNLGFEVSSAMRRGIALGNLTLGVKIEAVIIYGNTALKMKPQYMEGYCSGVSFGFQPGDDRRGIFLNLFIECHSYEIE